MPKKLIELATRRKTTRTFGKAPVNLDDIIYSIKVAVQAPSGANRQPWRFIIIDDLKVKERLRKKCEGQEKSFHENAERSLKEWLKQKKITWRKPFLTEAPIVLAILSNQEMPYATESTWLAIGYIILAFEERSLSTLTYTPPEPERLKFLFSVPEEYRIEAIMPIGYSTSKNSKQERRPYRSFIHKNVWKK